MSGRGRGRGRGKYAPPTGGRAFLMRSAEECGLDSRNLRSLQDITRPALFPDIKLHSSGDNRLLRILEAKKAEEAAKAEAAGHPIIPEDEEPVQLAGVKRTAQTLFLITKGREIHHRMQNSVFYVRPTKEVPDVVRYSDSIRPAPQVDAGAVLSNCLGGRKKTKLGTYVPEELVAGQRSVTASSLSQNIEAGIQAGKSVNLSDLEVKERNRTRLGSVDGGEPDNEGEEEVIEQSGEEEGGEDYAQNYDESEGEESGGDDGEPTF
eukprot:scaffold656_cov271-Chaetoceros_neogracile.AAC.29